MSPDPSDITLLGRDVAGSGYWLSFGYTGDENRHYLWIDPDKGFILRHLVQDNRKTVFDVSYDAYQVTGTNGRCSLPSVITVESVAQKGRIEIKMDSFLTDAALTADDFTVESPADYERVVVE